MFGYVENSVGICIRLLLLVMVLIRLVRKLVMVSKVNFIRRNEVGRISLVIWVMVVCCVVSSLMCWV